MLDDYHVSYKSFTEQYIDSSGIFKDVIIALLSTLAKQEKVRISERVKAGLSRTTKKGGRPQIQLELIEKIKALKKQGFSNRAIGKDLKISHSTVGLYV